MSEKLDRLLSLLGPGDCGTGLADCCLVLDLGPGLALSLTVGSVMICSVLKGLTEGEDSETCSVGKSQLSDINSNTTYLGENYFQ